MFCLAGIGGHLSGFVRSAKDMENLLVIDGYEIDSESHSDHAEISMKKYMVIKFSQTLGIDKTRISILNRRILIW
ncbi:MAG: hypothetical protein R2941_22120 [Desulfobacterales bacterium]